MVKILNEYYYIDLDVLDSYTQIESNVSTLNEDGTVEDPMPHIHVVKYETIKLLLDVIFSSFDEVDETLGEKSNEITIPFKLAFNTLLNKKIINKL
jgi:hypothetical protein